VSSSATLPALDTLANGSLVLLFSALSSSKSSANHTQTYTGTGLEQNTYTRSSGSTIDCILGVNRFLYNGTTTTTAGSWSTEDPESGAAGHIVFGMTLIPGPTGGDSPFTMTSGSASITGTVTIAGGMEATVQANISGTSTFTSTFAAAGEILPGVDAALESGSVSATSTLTIETTGLQFGRPPPPIAQPESGWIRKRKSGRRHSGAGRVYVGQKAATIPRDLPKSAKRIVDMRDQSGTDSEINARTLRDFLTLSASRAKL